jgi:hypothetical protein
VVCRERLEHGTVVLGISVPEARAHSKAAIGLWPRPSAAAHKKPPDDGVMSRARESKETLKVRFSNPRGRRARATCHS